jgi:glycerate 2-kinase
MGVARVAARHEVPVIGLGGSLSADASVVHDHGIAAIFGSVRCACSVEDAWQNARFNMRSMARNIAAAIRIGHSLAAVSSWKPT